MYVVELSERADKFLDKLDKNMRDRIKDRLRKLATDPVPSDSKFITRDGADKVFRARIGDYRALYKVKEDKKIVLIAKIDKRPRIYDRP